MQVFKIPKLVHGIYKRFIWDVHCTDPVLYLTFDDGPNPATTEFILDTLDEFGAKGTFFCVGENVVKYPNLYKEIINRGHSVGNHTMNHVKNRDLSTNDYLQNVLLCSEVVQSDLFRPPFGRINKEQATDVINEGFDIIMYTVLTNDYNPELDAQYILGKSIKSTYPGAIVVFHDSLKAEKNMKATLKKYIQHFDQLGFRFKQLNAFT